MTRISLLCALGLSMLAATVVGQTTITGVQPYSGPINDLGYYDLATQTFTSPPGGDDQATIYNQQGFQNFFASGPGIINMDWGEVTTGVNNNVIAFQVGYVTSNDGPVDMQFKIHEGATGFGDFGTIGVDVMVTGLPGSNGVDLELNQFLIGLVALELDFKIEDGPIGYSYEFFDDNTGMLIADAPFEVGVADAFDQYTSAGAYIQTANFGGFPAAPAGAFYWTIQGRPAAECLLVFGDGPGTGTLPTSIHEWDIQLENPGEQYEVLLDDYPSFVISDPVTPTVRGSASNGVGDFGLVPTEPLLPSEFAVQVLMWNPEVFPQNPEQYTNGLAVKINPNGRIFTIPYGEQDGMEVWAETGYNANGEKVISFPFSIDGLDVE